MLRRFILPLLGLAIAAQTFSQTLSTPAFQVRYDRQGVTGLGSPDGSLQFLSGGHLGDLLIRYRLGHEDWLEPYTEERRQRVGTNSLQYTDNPFGTALKVVQRFEPVGKAFDWTVELTAQGNRPVTIGDLAFSLPWRRPSGEDPKQIFEQSFTKHQFISGAGSFLYFTKPNGQPPYLIATCLPGTHLEYYTSGGGPASSYRCFVDSAYTASQEPRGTWRQANTALTLPPGAHVTYGLRFQWADSYDAMREVLYNEGLFDVRVVPGMTLPSDLTARIALHTKAHIESIQAEFPAQTALTPLGHPKPGYSLYEVRFRRLGENKLTIRHDHSRQTTLEFFSCEPLETLIKKRAHFLASHQQHRVPGKWYDGLYSVYDMQHSVLRGPDNTDGFDGWWGYVLACDDTTLGKAPFIAEKNVWYPQPEEIASLEYYIRHYVWGGLQRTDKELPYPYGIYGTPNWKVNRDAALRAQGRSSNLDKMHVWRSYDYPHMVMLYFHMYEIARFYPQLVHFRDAKGYLEMAYQTAHAYFTYPYEILPWYETYKWGCYNELIVLNLIDALTEAGQLDRVAWLRGEWEKKVKYFVYDDPYPFRSEYAIDRTAFESSYAFAKYGATHDMQPDHNLWLDKARNVWYSHPVVRKEDSRQFMDRQLMAGLAVRGWLETSYYLLGSDFTASSDQFALSYMAPMGGEGILDYGLNFAPEPSDWLQLGYASYLSAWALMNTGRPDTRYGFWFPGKENDGASGWQFMPAKFGHAWARNKEEVRGPWHYDGEIDLGYGGALRSSATVLTDDPIFGWFAYGGKLMRSGNKLSVVPHDGLRARFDVVLKDRKLLLSLDHDGFAAETPIVTDTSLSGLRGRIENRAGAAHTVRVTITPTGPRSFALFVNGRRVGLASTSQENELAFELPASGASFELR